MSSMVYLVVVFMSLASCGGGMKLTLQRSFQIAQIGNNLSQIREADRLRHGRMLQGVVAFPVEGYADPGLLGLYYTQVQLGSPPKTFNVQIDTGSDILWMACANCIGCPRSSLIMNQLDFFDPSNSSTVSALSCEDQRCSQGSHSSNSACSGSKYCSYTFQYAEGSGTSGIFLSDLLHFATVHGNTTFYDSAQVIFGCSTYQTGILTESATALDGVIGFGQRGLSVISQLYAQGRAPNAFSHCLKGSGSGGGVLVLGSIIEPSLVYTPFVPSQPHYNVMFESISVNGEPLPIRRSTFLTSHNQGGTMIDSGTTLAYFPQDAYQPLLDKVTQMVSSRSRFFASKEYICYEVASSISEIFPSVQLNFAGGGAMLLKPEDYLVHSPGSSSSWCIGFQRSEWKCMTILGDIVLKDKIVVYDVANQRIGWANHDCSQQVTVLETNNTDLKRNTASSPRDLHHWMVLVTVALLLQLSLIS